MISQIDNLASKSVIEYSKDISHLAIDTEQIVNNTKNTLDQTKEYDINSLKMVLNSALKTTNHSELNFTEAWVYTFEAEDVSKGILYLSEKTADGNIEFERREISNLYAVFPWFKEVPKEEKIYWSEPYVDKKTGNAVVTCLIPFMFAGETELNALVALTADLSSIQKNIYDFSFYEVGRLLLISRSGLYITHPDPDLSLKITIFELAEKLKLPELALAGKNILEGKIGQTRIPHSSVYDGPAIFFYAPVKNLNWGLFLVYSQNELLKPLRKIQFLILTSLVIAVLLLAWIISRICKKSTLQLISLSKLAQKYGQGNFEESFEQEPSSSELGLLIKTMSNMRTNLLKYTENERKEAAEKQKNKSEMEIACNIQKSSLSTKYPQHEAFKIATTMIPAKLVGGDFYDFFFIDDDNFAIVIADVSGKGIPAALYMMKAQTLIKNISKGKLTPDQVFYHTNNQLYEGNDTCTFVTAFMAVINLKTGVVNYVNAGHTPPIFNNKFIQPEKNIILGIRKNATFITQTTQINPGEHIFLYTDGVTEAENMENKFYGADRLLKTMEKSTTDPKKNLDIVLADIQKFASGAQQSDDITMLDFVYCGFKHRVTLPADNKKLRELIEFLKEDMARHNVNKKSQFNLVTAAEEIFSNIADYAYEDKSSAVVEMETFIENNIYYVRFMDNGKEYDPLKHKDPDVTVSLKDRDIGGLGIFMAKKLSDSIAYEYKDGKNILTIGVNI